MGSRVQIYFTDDELLKEIDIEAARDRVNRSRYICDAVARYIETQRFLRSQPELQLQMKKLETMLDDIALSNK